MKTTIHSEVRETVYSLLSGVPYGYAPYWYGNTRRPLCMDLILPKHRAEGETRPVIIWLCGGGFQQMDRSLWLPALMLYVHAGYIVVGVDYRVSAQAPYPAAVEDVKSAIRFLRAHAEEFGVDPSFIATMGESAGGYVASMSAVNDPEFDKGEWLDQSSKVQAVVDYYGKVDMCDEDRERLLNSPVAQFAPDLSEKTLKEMSPIHRIGPDAPPFLILHGTEDPLVPYKESEALYDLLEKYSVPVDMITLEGEGHGTDAFYQPELQAKIIAWLDALRK